MIRVTNASGSDHKDRFDGKDYEFIYGDNPVLIPEEAAVHMFGMGLSDKLRLITRLGWALTGADMPNALQRLDSFMLEQVYEEEPEEVEVATHISRPTEVPHTLAGLNGAKGRTKNLLEKAG